VKGVLSCFGVQDISERTVLANMGVEDEIGDGFPSERCLFDKKPLNFALEEPTQFEFLDPAFVASQEAIPFLRALPPGVHPLPVELDDQIISDWERAHNRKLVLK
jgi:adenosylhomocysteinase